MQDVAAAGDRTLQGGGVQEVALRDFGGQAGDIRAVAAGPGEQAQAWPRASSARATAEPTNPVAPVTSVGPVSFTGRG